MVAGAASRSYGCAAGRPAIGSRRYAETGDGGGETGGGGGETGGSGGDAGSGGDPPDDDGGPIGGLLNLLG